MRPLAASEPRVIGRYRMLAEIGRGGMGRVLLGCGPDGRLVAVKLVRNSFAEDQGFRARFRREVEAAGRVSGAYTAAVLDADPDADLPWLASVFVPGPSLQQAVEAAGSLPEAAVLRLAAGLAAALTEVHRAGLVHRDLKPSNVLLADDGPHVIDFGIARAVDNEVGGQITRTGWLVGSPEFMSPEQAESREPTPASDVFSLGVVLAAVCTGASPFTGTSTLQTLNNVVAAEPDLGMVPQGVRRIVQQCLAKDPARRPGPEQLVEMVGPIPPSARPWPDAVHELIGRQRAEVAAVLDSAAHDADLEQSTVTLARTRMQLAPPGLNDERSTWPPAHRGPMAGAPTTRRAVHWAITGMLAVVALVAGVLAWMNWPSPQAHGDSSLLSPPSSRSTAVSSTSSRNSTTRATTTASESSDPSVQPTTSMATVAGQSSSDLTDLSLFWNAERGDNVTCGTQACVNDQLVSGYTLVRREGSALASQMPGTVPLQLFWNADRGDNATCGTQACVDAQLVSGYTFVRIEGWVYPVQQPGTVPLQLFWNADRGDNATCGTQACVDAQLVSGYTFVRTEGWVYP